MPTNFDVAPSDIHMALTEIVRYLGHSHIAIKSKVIGEKGQQEGHFTTIAIDKAEDFIALRNGKRQLWINLQKLKPEVAGEYISFKDVESYKNVYIDLDCEKPNGFKDYAATDAERAKALSLLPVLKEWLKSHGLKSGQELHTGNGCGMVLPIPEIKAEPVFIAKLATFLKMVKAEIPSADTAMFDPPRVIGIPGTINAKLETDDRKNHMREVVGAIPERIEDQALLDYVNSLEPDQGTLKTYRDKYNEPQDIPHEEQKETQTVGTMSEDVAERLQELFASEPSFKSKIFVPAPKGKRSTHEFGLCARLWEAGFNEDEIYAIMSSSPQTKWQERNETYRQATVNASIEEAKKHHNEAEELKELSLNDKLGSYGYDENGALAILDLVEVPDEDGKDTHLEKKIIWVSDCIVLIDTETRAKDVTEVTFSGHGARDKLNHSFTLPAEALADGRKFRAALINAYGTINKIGEIDYEFVQKLSHRYGHIRVIERIEVPCWKDRVPLIPRRRSQR
jgi:hypothetical protein